MKIQRHDMTSKKNKLKKKNPKSKKERKKQKKKEARKTKCWSILLTFVCWAQVQQPLPSSVGTWVRFVSTLIKGLALSREFAENTESTVYASAERLVLHLLVFFYFSFYYRLPSLYTERKKERVCVCVYDCACVYLSMRAYVRL